LTVPGIAAGTPAFMAPEIALAQPEIDGRADLYSLGCVAYYLLTGHFVFAADTLLAAALAHVNDQPAPPSARSPFQIPAHLEALILQCLAKDPAERPASAVDLASRLAGTVPLDAWTADAAHAWWDQHRINERKSSGGGAASTGFGRSAPPDRASISSSAGVRGDCWPIRACWRPPSPTLGSIPLEPAAQSRAVCGFPHINPLCRSSRPVSKTLAGRAVIWIRL
jgi:serine/threonine protein kinase